MLPPPLTKPKLIVPWVALWSEEYVDPEENRFTLDGSLRYVEELTGDRDSLGTLWVRNATNVGAGTPLFGQIHAIRQRACMSVPRCQVCGNHMDKDAVTWLVTPQMMSAYDNVMTTYTPPTHKWCGQIAMEQCPHLRSAAELCWITCAVKDLRVWGYIGDLVQQDGSWRKGVVCEVGSDHTKLLMAKQLILALMKPEVSDIEPDIPAANAH